MIEQFVKVSPKVNAVQVKGENIEFLKNWLGDRYAGHSYLADEWGFMFVRVNTTKGQMLANFGDYVIEEPMGFGVAKKDEFKKEYAIYLGGVQ